MDLLSTTCLPTMKTYIYVRQSCINVELFELVGYKNVGCKKYPYKYPIKHEKNLHQFLLD